MSRIDLHIISFDIPLPADYGGVIDVFYKLKALSELGLRIHLHSFFSNRSGKPELEFYTKEISYYERNQHILAALSTKPYIIQSRSNKRLLENLLQDEAPILFEGIHTCAFLGDQKLKNRLKLVRTHNVEHEYYEGLRLSEKSVLKKQFYYTEAKRLAIKENLLKSADGLLAISTTDVKYFQEKAYKVDYLPVFHPYKDLPLSDCDKEFILYHGNLSVPMNEKAVVFLINRILPKTMTNLIVAGKDPSERLKDIIAAHQRVELVQNPSHNTLERLINKARINVLPAFETCGIKLKLLAALFYGGHCLASPEMLSGSDLEDICELAVSEEDWSEKINWMLKNRYTPEEKHRRIKVLNEKFNNSDNAKIIVDILKR